MSRPTEDEVITALEFRGQCMTYHIANIINMDRKYKTPVKTPQVLRLLKKMERAGKVQRVKSNYAVQICWAILTADEE